MRGEAAPGIGYVSCRLDDRSGRHAALVLCEIGAIAGVVAFESSDELLEGLPAAADEAVSLVVLPVDPSAHERGVEPAGVEDRLGHGQEHGSLGAGMRGQPRVGARGRVGEPRVDDDQLCARHLGLDYPLRMRVEVVAGLQMGGNEQYATRVRVVRRGPVRPLPEEIAETGRRRTDVDMRVVAVNPPALQHALHVPVVAGASDVVHDLLSPTLLDGSSDPHAEGFEHLVPGGALPLVRPAWPFPFHRVEHAVFGTELVHDRHALRAHRARGSRGVRGCPRSLLSQRSPCRHTRAARTPPRS